MPLRTRMLALPLLLLLPAAALAAPLTSATLRIRSDDLGLDPLVFTATGATGTATSPTQVTLDAGAAFAGTAAGTLTSDFLGFSQLGFQILANEAGSFSGSPIGGNATFAAKMTLFPGGPTIPVTIGKSYLAARTIVLPTGAPMPFMLAVQGSQWTELSNSLTPAGAGTLSLVAPFSFGAQSDPSFTPGMLAELELEFAPEPGMAMLTVWGIACLGVAARQRARRIRESAPPVRAP